MKSLVHRSPGHLDFIDRLVSHIPDKGQVLQRYYGYYSSRRATMPAPGGTDCDAAGIDVG